MTCAYCNLPLICEGCGVAYEPTDQAQYEALSHPDVAIVCPSCEEILVCHWCKTPYDGRGDDSESGMADV